MSFSSIQILSATCGDPPRWPPVLPVFPGVSTLPPLRWGSCSSGLTTARPRGTLATIDELLRYEVSVLEFDRDCANEFGRKVSNSGGRN